MTPIDLIVYRRYYCESCHQLKAEFGLTSAATVNYDMTFNTILLNSICGDVLDFVGTKKSPFCVFADPKADSELMAKMAGYTVLLTKWELIDDSVDKPSLKTKTISSVLSKAIHKAESMYPEFDDAVGKGFEDLRSMETEGYTNPGIIGKRFGLALAKPLNLIAEDKASNELTELFSNLTAAVYIMDAVDDLDQDFMDDTFNPYLVNPEGFVNKKEYITKNVYKITKDISAILGDLQRSYVAVKPSLRAYESITDNIIYHGIPESAKGVIAGSSNAKASIKNTLSNRKNRNTTY